MKILKINKDLCTGCGNCESICPEVFEVQEDGTSHIIAGDLSGLEGCIEAAEENCPDDAIIYEEEE